MSSLWGCRWGDHREARAVVGSAPDWDALQRGISGQLVRPGDDAYQRARTPFIAWFDDPEPQAVVRCAASEDVADGVAEVGAGTRLGDLYARLLDHGLTIPAGTCPSVGIGGLTLGGGHGILGRRYGLTLDHLLAARVVLAGGRHVQLSPGMVLWAGRRGDCGLAALGPAGP